MSDLVHVVSKRDNTNHAVCPITTTTPTLNPPNHSPRLPPSSVRAHAHLISLTSNNLGYARGGAIPGLHWWDTYPVPLESCPAPFNDPNECWGIVPAWGYGIVLESTIDAIKPGEMLFGFWPASGHAVCLRLEPELEKGGGGGDGGLEGYGYWLEGSEQRRRLLRIYNRYRLIQTPAGGEEQEEEEQVHEMAMRTLFLGSAGFLLNNFVFAPTSTSTRRLHPFGQGGPWSEEDADLTSAVVISLSASSKTGRSFAWELARDRDVAVHGPLALLQLTSVPGCVPQHPKASLPIMAARYDELERGMDWVASFRPSRVVIVDFGAAESVSESLAAAANKMDVAVSVIGVGSEAKVYSESELLGRVERSKRLGKVQLNTGALLDRALEVEASGKFMSKMDDAWRRCYEEGGFGDIELTFYRGVKGPRGIEGAWTDLCSQRVGPNVGIVVQLSGDE